MNMIRNLIGLIITITMLPICIEAFTFTSNIKFNYSEINDEIALAQLREQMLIAYDMYVTSDQINFIYKNKDFKLSLVNGKLILQPGTQIYLADIDDLRFETRNGCVYVIYERNNKTYERVICQEERLYIDDFSACDVLDDGTDCGEEWLHRKGEPCLFKSKRTWRDFWIRSSDTKLC